MNLASAKINKTASGILFKQRTPKAELAPASLALAAAPRDEEVSKGGQHGVAFVGLYLFTVMMYLRPQEILPGLFGAVPVVKFIAVGTILIYIFSKLSAGESLTIKPLELKMIFLLWGLGFIFAPISSAPGDSFRILFDPLIKTLLIFIVQINLVNTRARYHSLLGIMVFCGILYAIGSIKTFLTGGYAETESFHKRIVGWGGGMLGNPNDVACVLALLLPFTVIYALRQQGWKRWFFFTAIGMDAIAILCTFSRSGFLALVAGSGLILWKLNRGRRLKMLLPVVALVVVLFAAMPGKYRTRISTIFNPQSDTTQSAQGRQQQAKRALEVAIRRPVIGVGMGNFHIYGYNELRAHNSYLEVSAELGIVGLIAFLLLIFWPLRTLTRLEHQATEGGIKPDREIFIISVCHQASFIAFIIYGFFGSVQYDSYVYSLAAYAVALHGIRAKELTETITKNEITGGDAKALPLSRRACPTGGVLWNPQRVRRGWITGDKGNR